MQVWYFYLEKVRGVVDEGHQVVFLCNCERVVEDFIQNIMRKCPRSQTMKLGLFDYIFVMVNHWLEFLLNGISELGREPHVGF